MAKERKKIQIGMVISDKMAKTRVVSVQWKQRHPLYQRLVRQVSRFKAHDEGNESHRGDQVRIIECRPMSKDKRWRIIEILQRAEQVEVAPEEVGASLIEEFESKAAETPVAIAPAAAEPMAAPVAAVAVAVPKTTKAKDAAKPKAEAKSKVAAKPKAEAKRKVEAKRKEEVKPKRVGAKKADAPVAATDKAPKAEKKPAAKRTTKEPKEEKA